MMGIPAREVGQFTFPEEDSEGNRMSEEIKRMPINIFRAAGFLQEINRQILHPAGLALEVVIDEETGEERFGGVWDYSGDEEGIVYKDEDISQEKIESVARRQREHAEARIKLLGSTIQQPRKWELK